MMRLRNANFTLNSIKNPRTNDGEAMTYQELSLSPLRCFTNWVELKHELIFIKQETLFLLIPKEV